MKLEIKIGHSAYIIDFKEKQLLDLSHQPVKGARNLLSEYLSQEKISEPKNTNNHTYIGLIKKHLNVKSVTKKKETLIEKKVNLNKKKQINNFGKIIFSNGKLQKDKFINHEKKPKTDIAKFIKNVEFLVETFDIIFIKKNLFTSQDNYNKYIKENVQQKPGVYIWFNRKDDEIIYIGMAGKIKTDGTLTNHPIDKRLKASRCKDIETKKDVGTNRYMEAILNLFHIDELEIYILPCKVNEPAAHIESILLYNFYKNHNILPILNNAY